jgi:signal transduction protein with GAF and PtsI domain
MCQAHFSAVARFDDGLLHLVALNNLSEDEIKAFHSLFPRPPARNFVMGRAFVDGQPVQFDDVLSELDYDTRTREELQRTLKYRTFMAVPILKEGNPIGVIGCARREVRPFTSGQIELVKTFADQAVIAIGNVQLFDEVLARTRELGRRRPPRCCKSSRARPATSSRYSRPCSRTRRASVRPSSVFSCFATRAASVPLPFTTRRLHLPRSDAAIR